VAPNSQAGDNRTGVTFISPSVANPFPRKLPAAVFLYLISARSLAAFLLPMDTAFCRSALASAVLPVSL